MHPILFKLPLPAWQVPLFPTLLGCAAVGVVIALLGWRKKAVDLLVIGCGLLIGCTIAAIKLKGNAYVLSDLPVYSYGATLCLSLIVGWYLTLGLAKRDGLPRELMANCYFVTAVGALIVARILYVLTNPHEFHSLGEMLNVRLGGMVAYGGFIGGFIASYFFLRSHRIRLAPWADVAVPSLCAGLAITRVGCYLLGCDFGKPLGSGAPSWLKSLGTFPHWATGVAAGNVGSPAWHQQVAEHLISPDAKVSLPVHPTELYSSLAGLALLVLALFVRRHQRFRGEVFLAFVFGYGFLRFLIEILRADKERGAYGPFIAEHWYLTIALLAFAVAYVYGPSRAILGPRVRSATQVLSFVPAVTAFIALRPGPFAMAVPIQLSTSQWIGLLSALGAAFAWERMGKAADEDPVRTMRLAAGDEPLPSELARGRHDDEDDDEDDEPSDENEAPRSKGRRSRRRQTEASEPAESSASTADETGPDESETA
jgi:phosphatidylglycerol---prolipoprotein diacylglyceryl transferase